MPGEELLRVRFAQHLADAAVHDQVGVAADRRREVRVVLEREPEVTDVAGLVDGLRHRANHRGADQRRVRTVADLLQQVAQVLRTDLLGGRQPEAELAQELSQCLEPVELGQPMHAIQRRHAMPVEKTRRRHVGGDHAFLDQAVRVVARLLDDRGDRARARRT